MATSSGQPAAFSLIGSLIGCPVSEKLAKNNFTLWKLQVLSAIRGAQLEHYLEVETAVAPPKQIAKAADKPDELIPNPEYQSWYAKDQQVFNYLVSSVSKEILVQLSTCTTSAQLWKAIHDMTASHSRGRIINTRMALATAKKGSSSITDYFNKIKSLADDMAAAGKKLEDEEVASYVLAGLDSDYDPVVSTVGGRVEPLSLGELFTQLVSWEQRLDMAHGGDGSGSSANSATRGGRGSFNRSGGGCRGGRGCGRRNNGNGGRS
jgi:hypothetical protein